MSDAPLDEYRRRRALRDAAREIEAGRDRTLSNARLVVFGLLVAGAFAAFGWRAIPPASLVPLVAIFAWTFFRASSGKTPYCTKPWTVLVRSPLRRWISGSAGTSSMRPSAVTGMPR